MAAVPDLKEPPTLLSLPYDIRYLILEELLPKGIELRSQIIWSTNECPAISMVCEHLYEIGTAMFYKQNHFRLSHFTRFPKRTYNLSSMTSVRICIRSSYFGSTMIDLEVKRLKEDINTLALLAVVPRSLRVFAMDLTLDFESCPIYMVINISLCKAATLLRNVPVFEIDGARTGGIMMLYMNRKMMRPIVRKEKDRLYERNIYFEGAVKRVVSDLEETREIFRENYPEYLSSILDPATVDLNMDNYEYATYPPLKNEKNIID
jgi:hypothetical protein